MSIAAYIYRVGIVGLFIAFVAGAVASYDTTAVHQEPATSSPFKAASAPTVEFNLPDLVCDDEECALAVKDILARQPGAKEVRVDVEAKTATVAIDDGKFDSQIAIAELGGKGFHLELRAAAEFNPTGAPTVEFTVPDMMCEEGCAWTVKDILSKQPGAKDVRVEFEARTATVAFEEGKFNSELAIAELVDKGFTNSQVNGAESEGDGMQWTSYPPGAQADTKRNSKAEKYETKAANEESLRESTD
jgi:copper chaperone CopZ